MKITNLNYVCINFTQENNNYICKQEGANSYRLRVEKHLHMNAKLLPMLIEHELKDLDIIYKKMSDWVIIDNRGSVIIFMLKKDLNCNIIELELNQ